MKQSPSEIATTWKTTFGDFPPVGYVCRESLPSRWLRIHSLPRSKRYPDSEAEYEELLRRHNDVATAVLGQGEECLLFMSVWDEALVDTSTFVRIPELSAEVWAAVVSWESGRFDALIRAVADETAPGRVLFANCGRGTAYAPYDGGADLFFGSDGDVARMRAQWADWVSPRADGL